MSANVKVDLLLQPASKTTATNTKTGTKSASEPGANDMPQAPTNGVTEPGANDMPQVHTCGVPEPGGEVAMATSVASVTSGKAAKPKVQTTKEFLENPDRLGGAQGSTKSSTI